ncbi:MAG: hypothetical protein R2856_03375 [Caldilineaceae bacterium]
MNRVSEGERTAVLASYKILDTSAELAFDRITRLAAQLLDAPIAMINFIDADRTWSKSVYGAEPIDAPRSQTICAHTLTADDALTVADLGAHPSFREMPTVKIDSIRAYSRRSAAHRRRPRVGDHLCPRQTTACLRRCTGACAA